ncbi:hypothetical protein HY469_00435, partial [Candidatus Roizmanbacteria bacterium]|nr:hypothetical protein [Candidatus Roizmanbacteria bacterium]
MQLFIFGDSITLGMWDEKGGWAERLKQKSIQQSIDSHFEIDTEVYTLGVSGDTSRDLLYRFESEIWQRKDETESIISIAIGTNDTLYYPLEKRNEISISDFEKNIKKLHTKALSFTRKMLFVGLTPVNENLVNPIPWRPENSYRNEDSEKYNGILRDFCSKNNVPFV